MMPSKILFDDTVYAEMLLYKEVTGVSIQKFVTDAVNVALERLKIEQEINDLPNIKK